MTSIPCRPSNETNNVSDPTNRHQHNTCKLFSKSTQNQPHEGRITDPASFTVVFASSGCDLFCLTCGRFLLSYSSKSCFNSTELSFVVVRFRNGLLSSHQLSKFPDLSARPRRTSFFLMSFSTATKTSSDSRHLCCSMFPNDLITWISITRMHTKHSNFHNSFVI